MINNFIISKTDKLYSTFLIFLFFIPFNLSSQNLFEEKFEGCETSHFVVEKDKITVTPNEDIINILSTKFDKEVVKRIRGVLSFQILVYKNGESCVLSLQNKTNIETDKLNIKEILENNLSWSKPDENKSAIVSIKFFGDSVGLKRIGMNEKGFHEITELK